MRTLVIIAATAFVAYSAPALAQRTTTIPNNSVQGQAATFPNSNTGDHSWKRDGANYNGGDRQGDYTSGAGGRGSKTLGDTTNHATESITQGRGSDSRTSTSGNYSSGNVSSGSGKVSGGGRGGPSVGSAK